MNSLHHFLVALYKHCTTATTLLFAVSFETNLRGQDLEKLLVLVTRPRLVHYYDAVRSFGQMVSVPNHPTRIGLLSEGCDGGQVCDWKRKLLVVELPHWSGQCTSDGRLGLYVPVHGGLQLIDMTSGQVVHSLIGCVAEGVFTTQTMFTPNDRHVVHFHAGRSSVRVFRVDDGKQVSSLAPVKVN